ncbi:MAG: bifunctional oligoribonuclease/PAP phosphatase NrnA [Streptosporangiaceae bacterium]
MSTIPGADWDRAVAAIERADAVCLACHVHPDGDALGSMLAFALALRGLGKQVVASFGEPFTVPAMLGFLPGQELLSEPGCYPAEPKVMITFDAASRDRLGSLAPYAEKARELIVIDHHVSNPGFGSINLVDTYAAATAVVAERLLALLGAALTREVADGLYTGLASDTGSFKYPTTTPEVHTLAGKLVAAGVRPEGIGRELWDRSSFGLLKVLAGALERAVLDRAAGLVWTTVSEADRHAQGVAYDQLEGVIDVLRKVDEAEVAVVCKQNDEGEWYVSTRSKGAVDVGRLCAALGGGGHRLAAAFTVHDRPADAIERLRDLL